MALAEKNELKVLDFPNRVTDTRPQWRQEVSARLRDFQTRRESRDIPLPNPRPRVEKREPPIIVVVEDVAPGVVSLTQRKELDVRVVRALQRIERARATRPIADWQQPIAKNRGINALTPEEIALAPGVDEVLPPVASPRLTNLKAVENRNEYKYQPPVSKYVQHIELPLGQNKSKEVKPVATTALHGAKPWTRITSENQELLNSLALQRAEATEQFANHGLNSVSSEVENVTQEGFLSNLESKPIVSGEVALKPRLVCAEVIDEAYLERKEAARAAATHEKRRQIALAQGLYDDYAPTWVRAAATIVDWGIAFAGSLPLILFAALTESGWRWADLFLLSAMSMIGFMALYATLITYYTGRTWGQELLFLCVAQVENGEPPSFKQCLMRVVLYLISPLTLGISLFYAIWDAEGRTLHDKLSGTIVLRS